MDGRDLFTLFGSGRASEGLTIDGSLVLAGTRVRSLPAYLTVRGDLDLRRCERLHRIGEGLRVRGSLRIGGTCPDLPSAAERGFPASWESRDKSTPLRALPDDLEVGGSLELRNCPRIAALPERLAIGGSLVLAGLRSLTRIPAGLHVPADLVLLGGPLLTSLPDGLTVGRDLRISGTALTTLPEGLVVMRNLHLSGMRRLVSLAGVAVGGDLELHGYAGEELPIALVAFGDLRVHGAPRLQGTPSFLSVSRSLLMSRCDALTTLRPGLRVGRDLQARDCRSLVSLPRGLRVPGTLDLRGGAALVALPRGVSAGALLLQDCTALKTVPPDLHVGAPLDVAGTSIETWPKELSSRTVRFRGMIVPPDLVFAPWTLTPGRILRTPNAELRRLMLERVGIRKVLDAAGARTIATDRDAGGDRELLEVRLPPAKGDPPGPRTTFHARFLLCKCPSTGRQYLLGVPVALGSCHAAAAWLAGFDDPADYQPLKET